MKQDVITSSNSQIDYYIKQRNKKSLVLWILVVLVLVCTVISLNIGSYDVGIINTLQSLFGSNDNETIHLVIWNLRMPRVLAAIVAGAGLSIAGCIMQNNLKNPLASPSTLGISAAATFGANFAIILLGAGTVIGSMSDHITISNPYLVTIFAFVFSMITVLIILGLSKLKGFAPQTIILSGVALSFMFSAGTILLQYFADETKVTQAVFWTFGDLGRISWKEILMLSIIVFVSFVYFNIRRWNYNSLNNDTEVAKSLGVNVDRTRFFGLLVASLITSICVSFLGMISFIGLLGPHIMKRIVGNDYKYLIPGSALLGALILLLADMIARVLLSPVILPVGAITSLLGAPLFLYILLRKGNLYEH